MNIVNNIETCKHTAIIKEVGPMLDQRNTGTKLFTGYTATFEGLNKTIKVYASNNGNSLHCYVMIKGKRHQLFTSEIVYHMSIYKLVQLKGWYIETPRKTTYCIEEYKGVRIWYNGTADLYLTDLAQQVTFKTLKSCKAGISKFINK